MSQTLLVRTSPSAAAATICVDLDGTLIPGDLFFEATLAAILSRPLVLLLLPFWLLKGKAYAKAKIAECSEFDPANLPYQRDLLDYLEQQKLGGAKILLATAANATHAHAVARHLGIFDAVLSSTASLNLKGPEKLSAIVTMLAGKPFVYAGNSKDDLSIWRGANAAIPVNTSRQVQDKLDEENIPIQASFPKLNAGLKVWLSALRVHQWSKNLLVFAPLFLSHQLFNLEKVASSVLAFFAFSACASAFYVVNDLLDLGADRAHPRKRFRAFASGALSIPQGTALLAGTIASTIVLMWPLSVETKLLLVLYAFVNLCYSTRLKEVMFVDVITLAFLYTLRLLVGGAATDISVSVWTLAFSIFLFLGLALVKRLTELVSVSRGVNGKVPRRGYLTGDIPAIQSFASSALYLSVLVMALYINSLSVEKLYQHPEALWLVCLVLIYWVSRLVLLAHRGQLADDPILFALKDRTSHVVGLLILFCIVLAMPFSR